MATKLYNLCKFTTTTTGTGTNILVGSAVAGFLTPANAGVANGDKVDLAFHDGSNSQIGTATYVSANTTFTGLVITKSTAGGNTAISLSGSAQVYISPRAESLRDAGALTGTLPTGVLPSSVYTTSNLNSSAITTALTYTPANKAGDTFSGSLQVSNGIARLHGFNGTAGSSTGVVYFDATAGTHYLYFDGTNFNFAGSTNVIQTGSILATADIVAYYSDARLKTVISDLSGSLAKINSLRAIRYIPNDLALSIEGAVPEDKRGKEDISLLAQDVQAQIPEGVTLAAFDIGQDNKSKSGEDYLTIKWEKIVTHLVAAVQELSSEVEDLKKQLGSK
jgi:hypothetical protein